MPVIKSAKKKMRQDKKRTERNRYQKVALKKALKTAKASKTAEEVRLAIQSTDKAVKKNLMHRNKAARIKSQLAKLLNTSSTATKTVSPAKSKAKAKPKSKPKTASKK